MISWGLPHIDCLRCMHVYIRHIWVRYCTCITCIVCTVRIVCSVWPMITTHAIHTWSAQGLVVAILSLQIKRGVKKDRRAIWTSVDLRTVPWMWMWTQYTISDWMCERNHKMIFIIMIAYNNSWFNQLFEFLLSVVEHADVRTGWNDSLIRLHSIVIFMNIQISTTF